MHYKYRWWYAFFIVASVVGLGKIFILNPLFSHLTLLKEKENQLHAHIKQAERLAKQQAFTNPKPIALPRARSVLLSDLITQVQANGLLVLETTLLPTKSAENEEIARVKLIVQGDFLKLFLFINALNQSRFPMVVLDFSYEAKANDSFIFTTNLALFRRENLQFLGKNNEKIPRNPFCFSLPFSHQNPKNEAVKAQHFSLKTIKMTGYVEQEKQSQALLFLPDLTLISASLGDTLGKENAKITAIKPHYVSLLLPNQERIVLKR